MVRFGTRDFAKYPFLKDSLLYVTKNEFKLEDLDNSDYSHLIDLSFNKLESYLKYGKSDYEINYNKTNEVVVQEEVIIFLISLLIIKSIDIDAVTKKYALLESMRFEKYLTADLIAYKNNETIQFILYKIFEELFNTKIELEKEIYNFYKIKISDYLDHPIVYQEKEWSLVNRTLHKGYIYLDAHEIVRLFRNELYFLIIDKIRKMVLDNIPIPIYDKSRMLKNYWINTFPQINFQNRTSVTPPCIQNLYDQIDKGENLPHAARILLGTFLLYSNKSIEEMLELFKKLPDFNESITRYQLEHLAGRRGNSKRYYVPSCEKIKTNNLCFATDICRGITNPIQLTRNKT